MWTIYDDSSYVSSFMSVMVENPADYQRDDMILLVNDDDSGLIYVNGSLISSQGVVIGRMKDFVEKFLTVPVVLRVNWSCCISRSFPLTVYVKYNTSEGYMISSGLSGLCSAMDLRRPIPEAWVLWLVPAFLVIKLYPHSAPFKA